MPANSIQKRVAVALETGTLATPAVINWDAIPAPGGLMATTVVEDAELKRAYIDDATIRPRASEGRPMLRGLRSGSSAQLGPYMAGHTSGHAAAGDPGVIDMMDMVLRVAWGGQVMTGAGVIQSGTDDEPQLDTGEGANFSDWSWGFFWDVSTLTGSFRMVESEATDALTMATGHELPFTPAANDLVHAVSATYVDWDVAEDYLDAGNDTLQILLRGRNPDDFFHCFGVKPELQLGAITAGEPTVLTTPMHCVYFEHGDELAINPALLQSLSGSPGPIVGAGSTTTCWMAAVGQTLATQQFIGSITVNLGIVPERVMGPNGIEGVHGYRLSADSYDGTSVELTVDFDPAWRTAAEAGTEYHLLIQVGNEITRGPWALYFPRLSFQDDVVLAADGDAQRVSSLKFKALESTEDLTGLSEAVAHRARAKVWILRVA